MKPARLALLCLALLPASAAAQRVTVPVDVGVGPATFLFFGPVFRDQPLHTGLKLSAEVVLDREWLRRNQRLIPKKYRARALRMDEFRFVPGLVSLLVPDSLILSPRLRNTSLYGATWSPLGIGLPLGSGAVRLALDADLVLTYAYLRSSALPTTHFLRPGARLGVDLEFKLSRSFLISLGWSSALYVPQRLGEFSETQPLDASIFHVGQASLQLHFRFPFTTRL
jgi:hypothetical protein